MILGLHLGFHVFLSLVAGWLVGRMYKKSLLSYGAALAGGVAVDLDHWIDYILVYGFSFDLYNFTHGLQFIKSGKMHTFFHGWEYVLIFLLSAYLIKNISLRAVIMSLGLALLFHLGMDTAINNIPFRSYSIIYKTKNNFEMKNLLEPKDYQDFLEDRRNFGIK